MKHSTRVLAALRTLDRMWKPSLAARCRALIAHDRVLRGDARAATGRLTVWLKRRARVDR